jgi:ABC-type antimicrobial peptide transport system permease subunit
VEIVGITKDAKYQTLREVTSATVFLPATQAPAGGEADEFVVRTAVPPSTLLPVIQRTATEVNKDIPLTFRSLAEQVSDNVVQERVLAMLSTFFGALALLLAMIGLYGLLNYLVTQRLTEFGLRMALGAEPGSILRLMLRDVGLVLAGGVAAGLALSLPVVTLMRRMLFGLEPHDTTTIAAAVFLLSTLGLIAGYLPARRATKVDPMIALRSE